MKKILSLLALAGLSALTVCGKEFSAALPVVTYRGTLVETTSETYPSGVGKHDRMMTFRVYDTDVQGAKALWTSPKGRVTVNPDGSFETTFGDWALAELIATGTVTHVGLQLGSSAEITPRRMLRPVAAATRAIVAEGVTPDVKIGTLAASKVVATSMSVSLAEISEELVVDAGDIHIESFAVLEGESTRLMRGKGVKVFADGDPQDLGTFQDVAFKQVLVSAPTDGVALIHCVAPRRDGEGERNYYYNDIPGVIQFCKTGDEIKAPAAVNGGAAVKVAFWKFAK